VDAQQVQQAPSGEAALTALLEASTPAPASPAAGEASSPEHAGQAALPTSAAKVTKVGQLQALLAAPEGATLAGLCESLGWQSHTVRAALTRLRQAGHSVERSRSEDGQTIYRIAQVGPTEATDAGAAAGPGSAPPDGSGSNPDADAPAPEVSTSSGTLEPSGSGADVTVELTFSSKRNTAPSWFAALQDGEPS